MYATKTLTALYSAGTDGLLKVASSTTGQVTCKTLVQHPKSSLVDAPTILHPLTPQTLLLATDSSALHLYDLRVPLQFANPKPAQTYHPHDDYISSITPLPPTENSASGFAKQWITTGGSTLAVTDLRRGVLKKSEAQDEELLCSTFVAGLSHKPGRTSGEKILVGADGGYLTVWDKGVWDDQVERIAVDKVGQESLDCIANVPDDVGGFGKNIAVGVADGTCRIVRLGPNSVVNVLRHDEIEGVVEVGFDVENRLITGGGSVVKVWEDRVADAQSDEQSEGEEAEDSDSQAESKIDESSDEDDRPRKKKKKGKGAKGLGNGILGFKGMD